MTTRPCDALELVDDGPQDNRRPFLHQPAPFLEEMLASRNELAVDAKHQPEEHSCWPPRPVTLVDVGWPCDASAQRRMSDVVTVAPNASTIETLAKRSVAVRDREPTGLSRLSLYRLTVESIDVA
jgi:hypothetical protein